jgi:hypothetical protein
MLPKILPHLTSLIARLRRCDNSDITGLSVCCRALKSNDHAAPVGHLISFSFLRKHDSVTDTIIIIGI